MLADRAPKRPSFGRLDAPAYGINHSILRIVEFLGTQLPRWSSDPDRAHATAEDTLSFQLCEFLNDAARIGGFDFIRFTREVPDERTPGRTLDIGVTPVITPESPTIRVDGRHYSRSEVLLPIECKRLPTPGDTRRDEREYVTSAVSSVGAIQRFKAGAHGGNHEIAAIVGYVQDQSLAHWLATINAWIADIDNEFWHSETLRPNELKPAEAGASSCRLRSVHRRQESISEQIELHHLWVIM